MFNASLERVLRPGVDVLLRTEYYSLCTEVHWTSIHRLPPTHQLRLLHKIRNRKSESESETDKGGKRKGTMKAMIDYIITKIF